MSGDTISARELATRIRRPTEFVRDTLAPWHERGLVEEHNGGWRLTALGRRQFLGFASIFDDLAQEVSDEQTRERKAPAAPVAQAPASDPRLRQPRCSCGCGQVISIERYLSKHSYAEGHAPARKLSPREQLRRERAAVADTKPVTSTCARCGVTFGPGPVSRVRLEFKEHACEVAA